jgi:heme/copper-type cytochrome/quinol oxidase subunit 3
MQSNWTRPLTYDAERARQRRQEIALKNRRFGINLFQVSWIMTFVCLIIVNWQIRTRSAMWPPAGVQPLQPVLPTLATIALLVSALIARRALKAMEADDLRRFLIQWRAALLLGAAFVLVMAFEWLTLPPVPQQVVMLTNGVQGSGLASLYNTVFRVMTAFHGFHALVIGLYMLWVMRRAAAGVYSAREYWDAEAGAKLWYFVVIAWIMFYVVLYVV